MQNNAWLKAAKVPALAGVILFAVAWFQAWFLELRWSNVAHRVSRGDLVDAYVLGLARGDSYIRAEEASQFTNAGFRGDPRLRISDASYFQGRYYIYYGIGPFVTLLVPWFKLTGTFLSSQFCVWLALLVGYIAYAVALWLLARERDRNRPWILATGLLAIVFGSATWPLLDTAIINDLESAAAYACLALATCFLARAYRSARPAVPLVASSIFQGLAISCRPNCLPAVVVGFCVGVVIATHSQRSRAETRWLLSCIIAPLLGIGLALAAYNYIRFGVVTEFGTKYGTGLVEQQARPFLSVGNVPYNVYTYLLGGFWTSRYFPFVEAARAGWIARPVLTHEPFDHVYGCLWLTPILILAVGVWRGFARTGGMVLLAAFGNLLLLSLLGFGAYRYSVDFLGLWSFGAALGICALLGSAGRAGARLVWAGVALLTVASAVGILSETFSVAVARNLFVERRPGDFHAWAAPFNHVIYIAERVLHAPPRAKKYIVEFPRDKAGQVEPLLTTGEVSRENFIYCYYPAPGLVQFGVEVMGRGGPLSRPVPIDDSRPHAVDLYMGNFLPPGDHPLWQGMDGETEARLRRSLRLAVDGAVVLEDFVEPHPTRGREIVGASPDDAAFGRQFTGRIAGVPGMPFDIWPKDLIPARTDYGPLVCRVTLRAPVVGSVQPVLSIGNKPAGALLAIEVVSAESARFLWIGPAGKRFASQTVAWKYKERADLVVVAGALFPEVGSPLWDRSESAEHQGEVKNRLSISVGDSVILSAEIGKMDAFPSMVRAGENDVGVPGIPSRLDGEVSLERKKW